MNYEEIVIKAFSLDKTKNYGISKHRITRTEKKLNILLPMALKKFYLMFGKNKKLNINDEIFKIEDIFIDDQNFLVFGKKHGMFGSSGNYLGIKIEDIADQNPFVCEKKYKRRENKKPFFKWENINKTIEDVLLRRIIRSGIDGGFRYRFDIDGDQIGMHIVDRSIQAGSEKSEYLFQLKEIKNFTGYFKDYYIFKVFLHNDNWIFDVSWQKKVFLDEEEFEISTIHFGTERKDIYDLVSREFKERRFKIEEIRNDFSEDYQISRYYFDGPTVEFSSGKYIFYPERYTGNGIYKQRGSLFMHQDGVSQFYDLLRKANNDFDIYGISTHYNKEQTAVFHSNLEKRLKDMKGKKHYGYKFENQLDYYKEDFVNYRRYRKQVIKLLEDLLAWLKKPENKEISILGI